MDDGLTEFTVTERRRALRPIVGLVLTGGGALLHGLDARLQEETGMPIVVADNPLHSVAIGSGQCLEEFEVLKGVLMSSQSR